MNHFGEDILILDYIEPMDNTYDIEDRDELVEKLYDYLVDKYPFK